MRAFTAIVAILSLAAPALAQDSPSSKDPSSPAPSSQAQDKQAPAGDKQAPAGDKQAPAGKDAGQEPGIEKEAAPLIPLNPIEIGWSAWNLNGNERKFRQYATPPRGFFLSDLRYTPLPSPQGYQGFVTLKGPGQDDYRSEASLDYLFGRTRFEAYVKRNRFYDPAPTLLDSSQRTVEEVSFKQFLVRDFAVSLRYRVDDEHDIFDVPRLPQSQRTRYTDAIAAGRLGNGQLSLTLSNWAYFDHTGVIQDTSVDRWQAAYLWEPLPYLGIEGSYGRMDIKQPDAPASHVDILSLVGDVSAGPSTDIVLSLRRDKLSLPVVQNAYARENRSASARIVHRFKRWTAQFSLAQREVERVNGAQNFVDVPIWRTFDGRLSGRLSKQWRLTLRGSTQDLRHGIPMITSDPRSLIWDGRQTGQVRLEGGSPELNGYFCWSYYRTENSARSASVTENAFTIGGNWDVRPNLSFFAEFAHEAWSAQTGDITAFPTLDTFAPNSRIYALGLNWSVSPRTFVSLSYTDTSTANDNPLQLRDGNVQGHYFTLNSRYRFPAGHELGIIIAPWVYRDQVVGAMDYDTALVMLTGSAKF